MFKKIICLLSALTLGLSAASCKESDSESSQKTVTYNTDFNFNDSFFLPTTPPMCEYTYKFLSADIDRINDLVETAFGQGSFGRGKSDKGITYSTSGDYPVYNWYDETEQISAYLDELGSMSYFKGKYSQKYNDNEETKLIMSDMVFAEEFDKSITLDGKTVSYSTLTLDAQEKIKDCLDATGSSTEFTPICAREYSDESGKLIYVSLDYAAKFGTGCFSTEYLPNGDDSFSGSFAAFALPRIHAYYYTPDDIQGVWIQNAQLDEIKEGKRLDGLDAEAALSKLNENCPFSPKDITLCHAQLEYRPTDEKDGVMTARPFWCFYYKKSSGEYGTLAVDAVSGDISNNELQA